MSHDFDGLLDWEHLPEWLESQDLPGRGPVKAISRLAGGTQNNVFRIEREDSVVVLRRPPRTLQPRSNETILREARVLSALAGTKVPVPRIYAVCDDTSVIGACFYIQSYVSGFSPGETLPALYDSPPAKRDMAFRLVEGAAMLGAVDHEQVGLDGFGKCEGWVDRQVDRWRSQLEGYTRLPGYPRPEIPWVDSVGEWLAANRPSECRIGIIHGDYQFANVMFSHEKVELSAILDWELSTLGDPLLDLGWILASWHEPGDPPGHHVRVQPWIDFPRREELVKHYATCSGRDVSALPWYFALACYKLGIILEGTYARARSTKDVGEVAVRLHANAIWLLTKARELCC